MINVIKDKTGANEVLFICKTGSALFCDNCRDNDYLVVVDENPNQTARLYNDGNDYFIFSLSEFKELIQFRSARASMYHLTLEFAKVSGNTIYGECPIDFDWFAHKKEAIKSCLEYGERNFFNDRVSGPNNSCPKRMIWALATYYAISNGSIEFTASQKQILQLCHDFQLPKGYARDLKEKLLELYANEEET